MCVSMGIAFSWLARFRRKRRRVTFLEPCLKRQRTGKEVVVDDGEPSSPEAVFETGQSSTDEVRDIEVDPNSVRRALLERTRVAQSFLWGDTFAVQVPDGGVLTVDRERFYHFQVEYQEELYLWSLDLHRREVLDRQASAGGTGSQSPGPTYGTDDEAAPDHEDPEEEDPEDMDPVDDDDDDDDEDSEEVPEEEPFEDSQPGSD